ncbi:MAG: hypothetical protein DCC68_00935 [Planctomycetota bacterium]|nr:MAG: hypothetical protein DCC68_00935 [Planctomycetota bacterium]
MEVSAECRDWAEFLSGPKCPVRAIARMSAPTNARTGSATPLDEWRRHELSRNAIPRRGGVNTSL